MIYFKTNVILCAWLQKGWALFFACWPTLPVGRRRPHNNSRIRAIPSEEYSYVVATRSFPVAVGRERDTYGCASLSYY